MSRPCKHLWRSLCLAGLPLLGAGCLTSARADDVAAPAASTVRASAAELPAAPTTAPADGQPAPAKVLPVSLDTVFHLAEGQNPQVALARARVDEAFAEQDVAATRWLPNIWFGAAYWRHEGGIQNEDGTLQHSSFGSLFGGLEVTGSFDIRQFAYERVNAERKVWQHKGELSRISYENLLDAAETYIDLLAARTGEAIAITAEKDLRSLLERTEKVAKQEAGARVEVARIQADLRGREQIIFRLREQAAAASAKLVYLLGLDPCTVLVPVDGTLAPLDLIDAAVPMCDLVGRALATGPGIQEMEGLLNLIHRSIEQAHGPSRFAPVLEMRMAEGAFGAGPGDAMNWDNRWDLGVQARWNLTDLLTRHQRQRVLDTKVSQAHLAYQDLRAKLTLGVQESREGVLAGREQIRVGQEQIDFARRAYDLSDERLRNNLTGSSASEVLLSLQSLAIARVGYVNALRSYDKAQLRLLILTGPGAGCAGGPPVPPAAPAAEKNSQTGR
jgi:outer membrane protein TolC